MHPGEEKSPPIEIDIYAQMQRPEAGSRPKSEPPLVSAFELLDGNPDAVARWFEDCDTLSPSINLFFAVTGRRLMFTNVRFLLAVQALEVFHRQTADQRVMDEPLFAKLKQTLADAIPADVPMAMREKLQGLYQFANEPYL